MDIDISVFEAYAVAEKLKDVTQTSDSDGFIAEMLTIKDDHKLC